MKLGNVAASTTVVYPLDYCPEFLGVDFLATGTITSIVITTNTGGTIFNLNEAGIKALAQSNCLTEIVTTSDICPLKLAEGYIEGTVNVTVTTGAGASGVDIYEWSTKKNQGGIIYNTELNTFNANTNTQFSKFSKLIILSPTTSDIYTYNSNDGMMSQMSAKELAAMGSMQFNNFTDISVIKNDMNVKSLYISASTQRTVVIQRITGMSGSTDIATIAQEVVMATAPTKVSRDRALRMIPRRNG